jgi:AhpD family alkylhydroperoxidase
VKSVNITNITEEPMEPRMKNPAAIIPGTWQAIQSLVSANEKTDVPEATKALVHLRVSQINGCSSCLYGGVTQASKAGETEERLATVAAWRDAPFFTDAERAALALAEAVTRLADRPNPVPDEIWAEAAKHYDEKALASLILTIATTNLFNRLNASTRQVAGAWG